MNFRESGELNFLSIPNQQGIDVSMTQSWSKDIAIKTP